jgi:NADH-quinone oxidoreductase subunit G
VRFCEEVSGTGELAVVNRGDRSVVDAFPGLPLDNPLSLNVVDLCPVGALIDKTFMYQARVWFTRKTETVCASCSRGCNIEITAHENEIKRLTPRPNADVNQYWMCDEGRLNHRYVSSPRRLLRSAGSAREIAACARRGSFAGIVSTYSTIEEMWLFKSLMEALGASATGFLTLARGARREFPGGFVIDAERTPNRAYAEALWGAPAVAAGISGVVSGLRSGAIQGLLVLNGIPDEPLPADLVEASRGCAFLALGDINPGPLAGIAHVVLPGQTWAEKDGTYLNSDGRIQRIRRAVEPPAEAPGELAWLQEALVAAGARGAALSAEGVFREAMPGLDYGKVGSLGVKAHGYAG